MSKAYSILTLIMVINSTSFAQTDWELAVKYMNDNKYELALEHGIYELDKSAKVSFVLSKAAFLNNELQKAASFAKWTLKQNAKSDIKELTQDSEITLKRIIKYHSDWRICDARFYFYNKSSNQRLGKFYPPVLDWSYYMTAEDMLELDDLLSILKREFEWPLRALISSDTLNERLVSEIIFAFSGDIDELLYKQDHFYKSSQREDLTNKLDEIYGLIDDDIHFGKKNAVELDWIDAEGKLSSFTYEHSRFPELFSRKFVMTGIMAKIYHDFLNEKIDSENLYVKKFNLSSSNIERFFNTFFPDVLRNKGNLEAMFDSYE